MDSAVAFTILIALYGLPSIVAFGRGKLKKGGVVALNILLGWTFIGWLAALVWSFTGATRKSANIARDKFIESASQTLRAAVAPHRDALAIKRRQMIFQDAYGNYDASRWIKETQYFWDRNVMASLSVTEDVVLRGDRPPVLMIESVLSELGIDLSDMKARFLGKDPYDFERYCAQILQDSGWDARTTSSNDQGADVIATKDDFRIVLQCKLYNNTVGNFAVQEVVAAQAHESANAAAVVTNSTFTKSAIALAQTNGITLLHYDELKDWASSLNSETKII